MSRSERYIPPSAEELQRRREATEAALRFEQQRQQLLRAALKKVKKVDLVELTLRVAQEAKASEWVLEELVGLHKPVDLLVHDVAVAIEIATRVEDGDELANDNPEIDWRAYEAVQRGLSQLLERQELEHSPGAPQWAREMIRCDQTGFLCWQELTELV